VLFLYVYNGDERELPVRTIVIVLALFWAEIVIAALGLVISFTLPHLESISALVSSYREIRPRWHVLTAGSYGLRYLIAAMLIGPITMLMGASLTFLMRCLVRGRTGIAGSRAGLLFGINTAGAALGCLFADVAWIPRCGVWSTQIAAVLGISPLAVRSRLHRARARVQERLGRPADGPASVPSALEPENAR